MAAKITYLLLALVATCFSFQDTRADDNLSREVKGTIPSQDVVSGPLVKFVPIIRSQRSLDLNQIYTDFAPGFRGNFRRSGASGQFGQIGSSLQNGFANQAYPGGFNNAGPYGYNPSASVSNRFPANQGFGYTGGFRNPLNPINPSGFVPAAAPQGGFRNPINPVGFVPGGIQPGGFRRPINPGMPQGTFGNPVNPGYAPGLNNQFPNRNQLPYAMYNGDIANGGQGQGTRMNHYPDGSVGVRLSAVNETDEGTVHAVLDVVVVPNKDQNLGLQNRRNHVYNNQYPLQENKKIVTEAQKVLDDIMEKPKKQEPKSAAHRVLEKILNS